MISIASTVDRYNDDIHYKNGCHLSAQLSWAATMLGYQSRSPDPELVGDRWRDMWMERLEGEPFFLEEWLTHQRRDAFWKHGSICEDFDGFPVPALVIAGWADGYRNTPVKALEVWASAPRPSSAPGCTSIRTSPGRSRAWISMPRPSPGGSAGSATRKPASRPCRRCAPIFSTGRSRRCAAMPIPASGSR